MKISTKERTVIGSIIKAWTLTLLVLTLCTCSGPRLTLGNLTLENQTDYSSYSGKLVKPTEDVMVCVILRTDVRVFRSWGQGRQLTSQPYQAMHGLEYCPNLGPMRRKCSPIRLYPYLLTTHSFSNQYKTEWTVPRQNSHTEYPHPNSHDADSIRMTRRNRSQVSIPPLTGRTQGTMRTMGRNLNSSSTMRAVNGKGRTTSSTTGGSRKQH